MMRAKRARIVAGKKDLMVVGSYAILEVVLQNVDDKSIRLGRRK